MRTWQRKAAERVTENAAQNTKDVFSHQGAGIRVIGRDDWPSSALNRRLKK